MVLRETFPCKIQQRQESFSPAPYVIGTGGYHSPYIWFGRLKHSSLFVSSGKYFLMNTLML